MCLKDFEREIQERGMALLKAICAGRLTAVNEIVALGVELDSIEYGFLHQAVISGRLEIVRYLLDQGASVHVIDFDALTPLHHAADPEIAQLLLDYGADVYAQEYCRVTPIQAAEYERHEEVAKVLREYMEKLERLKGDRE